MGTLGGIWGGSISHVGSLWNPSSSAHLPQPYPKLYKGWRFLALLGEMPGEL